MYINSMSISVAISAQAIIVNRSIWVCFSMTISSVRQLLHIYGAGLEHLNITWTGKTEISRQSSGTLQSFTFTPGTVINNETRMAMTDALKHNGTLWSFAFDVGNTGLDIETGMTMADAWKHNGTLQFFTTAAQA